MATIALGATSTRWEDCPMAASRLERYLASSGIYLTSKIHSAHLTLLSVLIRVRACARSFYLTINHLAEQGREYSRESRSALLKACARSLTSCAGSTCQPLVSRTSFARKGMKRTI